MDWGRMARVWNWGFGEVYLEATAREEGAVRRAGEDEHTGVGSRSVDGP